LLGEPQSNSDSSRFSRSEIWATLLPRYQGPIP
jgi:hypothetical protein